ncbi:MAG: hypothetical protein ABL997_11810 [Planctomycetota bacterium]
MKLHEATLSGLDVVLNEADFVGLAFDPVSKVATVTLMTPCLAGTTAPRQRELQLLLHPVARLVASLRHGHFHDRTAAVEPVTLEQLPDVVRSFGGQPVYGFSFFDQHDAEMAKWGDRLSLDRRDEARTGSHSVTLFQEGIDRHLDLCIWFDELEALDERGMRIRIEDLVDDGRAWWQAFRAGDHRTTGLGLFPL